MAKYELTKEGRTKLKNVWTFTILASYATIAGIFAYNLVYKGEDMFGFIAFGIIILAMAGTFFYGRKKYFLNTDSTKLIVDDDKITLHVLNQPDMSIAFEDITQVNPAKEGIYLINKFPSKTSLFVMNKFERFAEIEKLVNDRLREYRMLTVG